MRSDIEAYRLMRAGRPEDALRHAQRAVAGQSACTSAHGLLATILIQLGRPDDAEATVLDALRRTPGDADAYDALAHVSMQLGQHERSNELYRRVVNLNSNSPRFWYNLASSERSFGRLLEAEDACDRAIALDRSHYQSHLLRSELRLQTPETNHVDELKRLLSAATSDDRARLFLGYALGKELDDLHRFDEAFAAFVDAAQTRRRHLAYDVAVDEHKLQQIVEAYPRQNRPNAVADIGCRRHIFVIGLPRSGTTLLERVLTGLPNVRSNGETGNFSRALLSATPSGDGSVFARAASADPTAVASNYERFARANAADAGVVEKMPLNYLYAGAIHRALPEASVLLVTRAPIDSCFAMYRTLFGDAYPFSYDFSDLARYYAAYQKLINHWRNTLEDSLFEVVYEDLVRDPQRVGMAVAGHCALTWVPSAVEVHKNSGVSLTASAAQIRRPIYGTSSGRWRHYRDHLRPLVGALRQYGVPTPDDA